MKKTFLQRLCSSLCLILLLGWGNAAWATTTYRLTQVTTVQAGEKYVFEQGGYVMDNTIKSNALQTTNSYNTSDLKGNETYVWTLEKATGGFYMKNVSLNSNQYLNNASSTNMSLGSKSSIWSFTITDGIALISNTSNDNHFLGFTGSGSQVYKAYATSNLSTYPHAIKVYKLEREPNPTHTVTFSINGATTSSVIEEDMSIPFPSNPADIKGMTFVGWSTTTISGTTNVEPSLVTSATMGSSDITYYAVFALASEGTGEVTDVLTRESIGVTTAFYSSWTGLNGRSGAVYAGCSAGGDLNPCIQLQSTESGIVTTVSGGKLKKIGLTWHNVTTEGRIIDVYVKGSAYTSATDLYVLSKQGTKNQSISAKDNEDKPIGDKYSYIGIRSSSGALYLTEVRITWETNTVYSNYCTTVKNANTITTTFETNTTVYGTPLNGSVATTEGYDDTVSASSSNTSVATVSIDGEGNVTVTPVSVGTAIITFSAPETSVYMAADNVAETITVTEPAAQTSSAGASAPTVTIAASGYGTYCCDYPLDFSVDNENYKAWYVSGVTGNTVTFTQIKGQITGGVPFILYGTPGTYDLTLAAASETTLSGNMLRGTLAPTYVETIEGDNMNFGLSGGKFVRIANGVLPAHKAFLPLPASQYQNNSNARLSIVFADEVVTDIETARRVASKEQHVVYDMQGRRVSQPQRGLYIKDGKKVLVSDKR